MLIVLHLQLWLVQVSVTGEPAVNAIDRIGEGPWNSAHPSRGCSQENLHAFGGDGLYYCFAAD